jgi:rubrerythrin
MFPVEKLLRDIRLLTIYEGTSEVLRGIVAAYAMKEYRPVMPPLENLAIHRERDGSCLDTLAWRCPVCGYVHYEADPPEFCPFCFVSKSAFKKS